MTTDKSPTGSPVVARAPKRRPRGAGSIRQFRSGRWQVRVRQADGTMAPGPFTFDTKMDAAAWLQRHGHEDPAVWADAAGHRPQAVPTLKAYAEGWLDSRDLKPRTRADYRVLLDKFILPDLGGERLDKITPALVRVWHAKVAPDTATYRAHAYGLLRTILGTAVTDDVIAANPCRIRGGGQAPKQHTTKIASLDELDVIVNAMPERYRAMVLLAAWCGLRFGELTELRRSDLEVDVVHVRRGVVRAGGEVIVGTPKSTAGVRTVSIPPHIQPAVEAHLRKHVGKAPGDLVFPARNGTHMAPSALYRVWYPARAKAGRPDLRFHDLRHTGLTLAAAAGATLADLMQRAGHSTSQAAMVYQHSAQDRDAAIGEALSGFAKSNVVTLRKRA